MTVPQPVQSKDKANTAVFQTAERMPVVPADLGSLFDVGLLLLISCVNVSNLLLSKASARYKEIAVRASLGASRLRIVRQLLCESIVLALMGGLLGIFLAKAGLAGIIAMVPPDTVPDEAIISLNTPVLLFALAISVAGALIFGLAPALHLSGGDIVSPLKEAGRGATGGKRQRFLRGSLVIGEVALSLMLLVGASLMIRTLFAIEDLGLGIQPSRILTVRVPLSDKRYPDTARRNMFFRSCSAVRLHCPASPQWDSMSECTPFRSMDGPV